MDLRPIVVGGVVLGALWVWRARERERRIADAVLRGYAADFIMSSQHPAYSEATLLSEQTGLPPVWIGELWDRGYRDTRLRQAAWAASDALEARLVESPKATPERLTEVKTSVLGSV